ncbi:MAG: phage virion morphogenesis protein [Azoarcus sp.]|jgi:phage virion morphogenesis protein|nr:phage virion morphogenesis protein [Azoarcus sp.]
MSIEIKLVGNKTVLERLSQLASRMDDLTPAMTAIGAELKARVSNRFETQTDPDGIRWTDWAPSTKKSYPKEGNHTVLDRYGHMLDSLGFRADKNTVTIGFGSPYATYHEFGTKKMPRRGLLFTNPETRMLSTNDETTVLDILQTFLREPLR